MTTTITPFHIAIPVHNLAECRKFYSEVLNCKEGRSSDHWVDFNLFGHQLVIHYKPKSKEALHTNICLLYTSPSPRDQRGSRMPSSA